MNKKMQVGFLLALSGLAAYAGVTALIPPLAGTALFAGGPAVPGVVNHQGVIAVNGARFNGGGLFRFAIINSATGLNLWTNDGTQVGSSNAPAASVSLSVSDGIYNVALGDSALANMTAIPSSVFSHSDTSLRIWFDDGVNGSQQLSPDHKLRTAGYAFRAETVSSNGVGTAEIADNAVTTSKLAAEVPIPPVGGIIAWHKSLPGTPTLSGRWVECNGQTLNDADSPYNGQVIPNLNGQGRFLRGSATSGALQADQFQTHQHAKGTLDTGSTSHTHAWSEYYTGTEPFGGGDSYWGGRQNGNFSASRNLGGGNHNHPLAGNVGDPNTGNSGSETRPINMSVVWIMRVK